MIHAVISFVGLIYALAVHIIITNNIYVDDFAFENGFGNAFENSNISHVS